MDEKWETPELVEYGTADELTEGLAGDGFDDAVLSIL
jgi:hypothetical protein